MKTHAFTIFALIFGFSAYAADDIITQAKTFNLLQTSMSLFEKGEYDNLKR